ncbi:hypothetical protein [uncultured Friedmanniella sp.]|uniref:hypothetical protein n=1 Tax=uncultured Friedmanniella sp. TaxID=335381 RepID=UPI0035CAD332
MPDAISTTTMPGDSMSPDTITSAAAHMRKVGTGVSTQGGTVLTAWQKLSASYDAPEDATLFSAMNPVKTDAEEFGTDVGTVATALETFAEEVRTIKAAVATIRSDAKTFLAGIAHGVEKTTHFKGETMTTTVDWNEDQASVDANNALIRRTNDQQEALWAAERTCANAIYDVYGHAHISAASEANGGQGYGVDQIPDNAAMPWGQTVERKEDCSESIVHGIGDGVSSLVGGLAGFAGFSYEPGSDLWDWNWDHSWSTMGQTFKGLGMFVVGAATMGPLGTGLATQIPGPVGSFIRDSQMATAAGVASWVGIDAYADDPFHKWKENGWRTLGESGFNIATFFVAPTKLGSLGKFGRVAETVVKVTDPLYLATKAAEGLRVLSGPTMEALARLARTADLDGAVHVRPVEVEIPVVGRDHVSTDVPGSGHDPVDVPPARDQPVDRTPAGPSEDAPLRPGQDTTVPDRTPVNDGSTTSPGHPGGGSGTGTDGPTAAPGHTAEGPTAGSGTVGGGTDGGAGTGGHHPADTTPVNDPQLAKSDPVVRAQVDQIRTDIGPQLQHETDVAWQHAVDRVAREGSAATPQRLGSYAHTELAEWLRANGDTLVGPDSGYRIRPEISFDATGQQVPTGTPGSIRPDIVIERTTAAGGHEVVRVIDLKTGKAGISTAWEARVQGWLAPLGPSETLRPTVPAAPAAPAAPAPAPAR